MRTWKHIGRCTTCDCWIAWRAAVPLSQAFCGACGEPLSRTTFPTRKGARVLYCERPVGAERLRRTNKVVVSERDRLLAEPEEGTEP